MLKLTKFLCRFFSLLNLLFNFKQIHSSFFNSETLGKSKMFINNFNKNAATLIKRTAVLIKIIKISKMYCDRYIHSVFKLCKCHQNIFNMTHDENKFVLVE